MNTTRETSVESFRSFSEGEGLGDRQRAVLAAMGGSQSITTNEIFQRMYGERGTKVSHPNIHSRLNELAQMGVISENGTKICAVTGKRVIAWGCTGEAPKKLTKIQKLEAQIKKTEERLASMKGELEILQTLQEAGV